MRNLKFDKGKLESLCREYYVKRLAVFGSVIKGEDKPGSDLDLLVEFEAGKTPDFAYFPSA
jgi:predicted nucleotidyltransferase